MLTSRIPAYCLKYLLVALSVLVLASCARNISSGNYSAGYVGEALATEEGVITGIRVVEVSESESLSDNVGGALIGGVAGGVLGNQIGGGTGRTVATVGGAALGALGGAYAQDQLGRQEGFEITVRLDNGQQLTIVQGTDVQFYEGQRVRVILGDARNRSRVTPL